MKLILLLCSLFFASGLMAAPTDDSALLRDKAEKEISIPATKQSSGQRLATVDVPLPELPKQTGNRGSLSLLFTSQPLRGQSRYVQEGNFNLDRAPNAPTLALQVERELSFLPVSLWGTVNYSTTKTDSTSPLNESDPIRMNTISGDIGAGYRLHLFKETFVNAYLGYGRFWFMQNSLSGLANQSTSSAFIVSQLQVETTSLWGSAWRPLLVVQKRWGLDSQAVKVADPRVLIGLMYREGP